MKKTLIVISSLFSLSCNSHAAVTKFIYSTSVLQPGTTIYLSTGTISNLTATNILATTEKATNFQDRSGNSIYGNFLVSSTVVNNSSMSVTIPGGYTKYKVRGTVYNKTGLPMSVFMRFGGDSGNHYGYSESGFNFGVSTGAYCQTTTANAMAFTVTGSTNGWNDMTTNNVQPLTFDINLDFVNSSAYAWLNGTVAYTNANNGIENLDWAGAILGGTYSSIQVWVGVAGTCTLQSDPLTGTSGDIEVWGVN